jgi:3-dehydrotetronate 4-kinase
MRDHPLTPMRDSDLVRLLGRQTPNPVALVPHTEVSAGPCELSRALSTLAARGVRHAVVDALTEADLMCIAAATAEMPLLTGAAGLARAVAAVSRRGAKPADNTATSLPSAPAVVLAGSCSPATLAQVELARTVLPAYRLDPRRRTDPARLLAEAMDWLSGHLGATPALIFSSAPPEDRDTDHAGVVEHTLGMLARYAVAVGARRVIVAGGETAAAVVDALGLDSLVLGEEAEPGVPWLVTRTTPSLALLLKSGNFGRPDLLLRASAGPHASGAAG